MTRNAGRARRSAISRCGNGAPQMYAAAFLGFLLADATLVFTAGLRAVRRFFLTVADCVRAVLQTRSLTASGVVVCQRGMSATAPVCRQALVAHQ